MATDEEQLVLSISADTRQILRAMKRLESDIARSSAGIEKQFASVGKAIDKAMPTEVQNRINKMVGIQSAAVKEWTGALAEQGQEMERLRARFNPIFSTITRYKSAVNEIRAAHRLGAISADEMTAAIQRERQAALAATAAIKGRNAALAGGVSSFNTANIAAQFQDVGVTAAMGMNPLQIALQQGTQISAILNQMGKGRDIVAGLGAAFASIVNPVSLVTIGLVAAGAAAVQYGMSLWETTEDTEKALKEQADLIQRVAQKWGEALPALKAYADEQERLAVAAERGQATNLMIARSYERVAAVLPQVNAELSKFGQEAAGGGWGSQAEAQAARLGDAYDNVEKAFAAFNAAVKDGRTTTDEYAKLQQALTSFTTNSAVPATGALRDAVTEMATAYRLAAAEAGNFANQQALAEGRSPRMGAGKSGRTPGGAATLREDEFAARFGYDQYFNFPKEKKPAATRAPKRTPDDRFFEDIEAIKQRTIALAEERAQLGLSYEAQVKRKTAFDLEQKALKDVREAARQKGDQDWQNAKLTPDQIKQIDEVSAAYARQAEELRKAQDELSFQRDLLRGALGDLKSALADGKLDWEEMGQIALNVLDKITDKLLNEVIDALFQVGSAGSGGGGGLLGFILSVLGGGFKGSRAPGFASGTANTGGRRGQPIGVVHGQEAVIPLPDNKKVPVQIQGGSSGYVDNRTITIDARGAQQGVGEEIRRALEAYDKGRKARLAADLPDLRRRGALN